MCFRLTSVAPTSLKFVRAHYRSAGIYSPVAVSSAMVPQAPLTVSAFTTNQWKSNKKKSKAVALHTLQQEIKICVSVYAATSFELRIGQKTVHEWNTLDTQDRTHLHSDVSFPTQIVFLVKCNSAARKNEEATQKLKPKTSFCQHLIMVYLSVSGSVEFT